MPNVDINKGAWELLAEGTSEPDTALTVKTGSRLCRVLHAFAEYSGQPSHAGIEVRCNGGEPMETGKANVQYSHFFPYGPLIAGEGVTVEVTAPAGGPGITCHVAIYGLNL